MYNYIGATRKNDSKKNMKRKSENKELCIKVKVEVIKLQIWHEEGRKSLEFEEEKKHHEIAYYDKERCKVTNLLCWCEEHEEEKEERDIVYYDKERRCKVTNLLRGGKTLKRVWKENGRIWDCILR